MTSMWGLNCLTQDMVCVCENSGNVIRFEGMRMCQACDYPASISNQTGKSSLHLSPSDAGRRLDLLTTVVVFVLWSCALCVLSRVTNQMINYQVIYHCLVMQLKMACNAMMHYGTDSKNNIRTFSLKYL